MLFRTINNELVEINKYDFINDRLYYDKLHEIHNPFVKQVILSKLMPSIKKTLNNKNK